MNTMSDCTDDIDVHAHDSHELSQLVDELAALRKSIDDDTEIWAAKQKSFSSWCEHPAHASRLTPAQIEERRSDICQLYSRIMSDIERMQSLLCKFDEQAQSFSRHLRQGRSTRRDSLIA